MVPSCCLHPVPPPMCDVTQPQAGNANPKIKGFNPWCMTGFSTPSKNHRQVNQRPRWLPSKPCMWNTDEPYEPTLTEMLFVCMRFKRCSVQHLPQPCILIVVYAATRQEVHMTMLFKLQAIPSGWHAGPDMASDNMHACVKTHETHTAHAKVHNLKAARNASDHSHMCYSAHLHSCSTWLCKMTCHKPRVAITKPMTEHACVN
mmetsp:Transcript_40145/g.89069  ORF Transcript_40145/g.89069 Transcript_40145/m.89069 type:complete len:203 (+) Transcript_40145:47-655(+)